MEKILLVALLVLVGLGALTVLALASIPKDHE